MSETIKICFDKNSATLIDFDMLKDFKYDKNNDNEELESNQSNQSNQSEQSNDIESNDLESNDLESDDLESNDLEFNDSKSYLKTDNKKNKDVSDDDILDEENLTIKESDKILKTKIGDILKIEGETGICTITKLKKYETYIFSGSSSKKILKDFINDVPEYTKIIQILDLNGYRRFLPIQNWIHFWNIYLNEPIDKRYLFEVIQSDKPCKPYLDVEWKKSDDNIDPDKFIKELIKDIIMLFKRRHHIVLPEKSIMITSSHSDTKISFHIVIDHLINNKNIVYETNVKGCKASAYDLYASLIEHKSEYYYSKIDGLVYTLDREFRTIFSNKINDFRPMIPYGYKKIDKNYVISLGTKECLRYIVTHYTDKYIILEPPEQEHKNLVTIKNKIISLKTKSNVIDDDKILKYLELVKKIHPTAFYTGNSRFSYTDRTELCYTGVKHDSNGFYVYENIKYIYMKCMSSNCKKTYILTYK